MIGGFGAAAAAAAATAADARADVDAAASAAAAAEEPVFDRFLAKKVTECLTISDRRFISRSLFYLLHLED